MAEMMWFPDTVEEYMEQYKIVDTEHVYTNGTELVPIFRMKQWFDHLDAKPDSEAELKAEVADLKLCNERLNGEIRGLKFAIRCNGVSGAEVTG